MKIGFIGTGLMGAPMIKNLLKSKHQISIFNRTISKAKKLKKYGAYLSYKIEELVKDKEIIITMLTDDKAVNEILRSKIFLNNVCKETTVIDMSSTKPSTALDNYKNMRSILCLFEGCATGAADGYYRMKKSAASTLLHLGPGLANGLANLHNAKKANSGIVNIVGEHALDHIKLNAPLTSDIEGIARPVSNWIKTSKSSKEIGMDAAEAIKAANKKPGEIATLILPGDTAWNEGSKIEEVILHNNTKKVPTDLIEEAISEIRKANKPLILVGGPALEENNLVKIALIAEKLGCELKTDWFNARLDKGAGRINSIRIPYVVDKAVKTLKKFDTIITIGARQPVAYFAYPNKPGILTQDKTNFIDLAGLSDDITSLINEFSDLANVTSKNPKTISEFNPTISNNCEPL